MKPARPPPKKPLPMQVMIFSQLCHWRPESARMWCCVIGFVLVQTSTSKEHTVLNFGIKQSCRHCLTFKMITLCCYTILDLYTQWHGHIPKELNLAVCWQNCDTTVCRHLWYCVHVSVQSGHFLLPVNIWSVLSSDESVADTKMLPKLQPVQLGSRKRTAYWIQCYIY